MTPANVAPLSPTSDMKREQRWSETTRDRRLLVDAEKRDAALGIELPAPSMNAPVEVEAVFEVGGGA